MVNASKEAALTCAEAGLKWLRLLCAPDPRPEISPLTWFFGFMTLLLPLSSDLKVQLFNWENDSQGGLSIIYYKHIKGTKLKGKRYVKVLYKLQSTVQKLMIHYQVTNEVEQWGEGRWCQLWGTDRNGQKGTDLAYYLMLSGAAHALDRTWNKSPG